MTKAELVALVRERVPHERGQTFHTGTLDYLIEADLVPKTGSRGFGWRHFHRVAFILACQQRGMTSRDALLIRLFIAGCKMHAWELRDALIRELRRGTAILNHQVRSTLAENQRALTTKRAASLARQLGPLDDQFDAAGLATPVGVHLDILRSARQKPVPSAEEISVLLEGIGAVAPATVEEFAAHLGPALGGLLQMGLGDPAEAPGLDTVEGVIRAATVEQLETARQLFRWFAAQGFGTMVEALGSGEATRPAVMAGRRSIQFQPQFMVTTFWFALLIAPAVAELPSTARGPLFSVMTNPHLIREILASGINSNEMQDAIAQIIRSKSAEIENPN